MDNNFVDVDLLFETSWEVCNKVGGIYTVLSTKAKTLQKYYKDKVIFIGPDVWSESNPSPFFIEDAKVLSSWQKKCELPDGVTVRTGRWDIPGKPMAVLVKFDSMYAVKDEFYGMMWDKFGVDSLHAYGDYDEACAFSHAAGIVIESIYHHCEGSQKNVIAHFDEWTTGMGLLYTKIYMPQVATIFTTHATSIGRSICGNGKPLYDYMSGYNGDQMAGELNMQSKHSLEKAAAHQADCFTTVSDITARECTQLLERTPDVVTPNGFEPNFVPAKSKFSQVRAEARECMLNVANSLTGGDFDDDTFIIITSGRCEYRNKGLDMFIDVMDRLREFDTSRRVLAFVMVPAWCDSPRKDLQWAVSENIKSGLPLGDVTHTLYNAEGDGVIQRIRQLRFFNTSSDRVSVIYVPCYLNGNDGVFNKSYYQLLIGADATVFPSYYEPWGYTPLESVAFHVPTVTTSLSGFGAWVLSNFTDDFESCGVNVVERTDSNYHAATDSIARDICFLVNADHAVMHNVRAAAEATAKRAAWQEFIEYYLKAFDIALNNEKARVSED
ncbi:MAG: glycogen/starch synthase [Paramuribaculum sp.]|nr:glycogen/starch synthase [Paramuribaculum sp.]